MLYDSVSFFQVVDKPWQKNRKRKVLGPTKKLVRLATNTINNHKTDKISASWAIKLGKIDLKQPLFVKKTINHILFDGKIWTFYHYNSVKINSSCVHTISLNCTPKTF